MELDTRKKMSTQKCLPKAICESLYTAAIINRLAVVVSPSSQVIHFFFQQKAQQDRRGEQLDMNKLTIGERRAIEEKPRSGRKK